jgi:hypothetical protein
MDEAGRYLDEVSELYLALRGAGLVLSPLDQGRITGWAERGVPLPLALRALREAHARWAGSGPGPRKRPFALRTAESFVEGLLKEAGIRSGGIRNATSPAPLPAPGERRQRAIDSLRERARIAGGAASAAYAAAAEALVAAGAVADPWQEADEAQAFAYLRALPRPAQRVVARGAAELAGPRRRVPPAVHRGTLRAWLCEAARSHGGLVRASQLP